MLLGARVERVDPSDKAVELSTGRHIHFDKLLLATGVRNRRPPISEFNLPAVLALRSVTDSDALRDEIRAIETFAMSEN